MHKRAQRLALMVFQPETVVTNNSLPLINSPDDDDTSPALSLLVSTIYFILSLQPLAKSEQVNHFTPFGTALQTNPST
eukprot:m.357742 g.357742  ORF g.357742 m.357742 type:complete len:78 (-) comp17923_c0_seq1:1416-1649(-)